MFAGSRNLAYSPLLKRRLQTSQHEQNKTERLRLAHKTFYTKALGIPKTVLLIDDIMTTGATLQACVAVLREAGAQQVFVAVVARQMIDELPK
jgi:predicted amidophosphoribosyltransferase